MLMSNYCVSLAQMDLLCNLWLMIRLMAIQANRDPVVQSIVSLTSSLVVKMLSVLLSTYLIHRYFC